MTYRFQLRTRVEPFKGSGQWQEVTLPMEATPESCALLLCDVWDNHWCPSAARRCDELAPRIGAVVEAARLRGVQIVHAPSDCMEFYAETPQRRRMETIARIAPETNRELSDPPLPIDDSDNGCDDAPAPKPYRAWTRQHPAIRIAAEDAISDSGAEVYSLLRQKQLETLLICGVHTNMCVLGRSFAIRQMTRWGVACLLIRDLTDAMYNPQMPPFVSHAEGTELVVQHIEKYWCPTILSDDLLR